MAIQIILYKTNSPTNMISKTLSDALTFSTCALLDTTDVRSPRVRLTGSDLSGYNYMHIPALGRYYYIKPTVISTGLWELNAAVDVLMSFSSQIRAQGGILARSENIFNTYLTDDIFQSRVYRRVQTILFSGNPFSTSGNGYYLTTTGGYPEENGGE